MTDDSDQIPDSWVSDVPDPDVLTVFDGLRDDLKRRGFILRASEWLDVLLADDL